MMPLVFNQKHFYLLIGMWLIFPLFSNLIYILSLSSRMSIGDKYRIKFNGCYTMLVFAIGLFNPLGCLYASTSGFSITDEKQSFKLNIAWYWLWLGIALGYGLIPLSVLCDSKLMFVMGFAADFTVCGLVLAMTTMTWQAGNDTYRIKYCGHKGFLALWALLFPPITFILFKINGFAAEKLDQTSV